MAMVALPAISTSTISLPSPNLLRLRGSFQKSTITPLNSRPPRFLRSKGARFHRHQAFLRLTPIPRNFHPGWTLLLLFAGLVDTSFVDLQSLDLRSSEIQ